jgi:hypothetical protein
MTTTVFDIAVIGGGIGGSAALRNRRPPAFPLDAFVLPFVEGRNGPAQPLKLRG